MGTPIYQVYCTGLLAILAIEKRLPVMRSTAFKNSETNAREKCAYAPIVRYMMAVCGLRQIRTRTIVLRLCYRRNQPLVNYILRSFEVRIDDDVATPQNSYIPQTFF